MTVALLCGQAGCCVPVTSWAFGENSQPCTGLGHEGECDPEG